MKELLKKLSKAKIEIGGISKDQTNPFFKSKYFDINALIDNVDPVLENNGLLLSQPIINGSVFSIIYDVETGEKLESSLLLPDLKDPQKLGSAITYYRRYTLQSLMALAAEDDDGNGAAKAVNKPVVAPYKKRAYTSDMAVKGIENQTPLATMMKNFEMNAEDQSEYIKLLDDGKDKG
jgi:hypothetical protein